MNKKISFASFLLVILVIATMTSCNSINLSKTNSKEIVKALKKGGFPISKTTVSDSSTASLHNAEKEAVDSIYFNDSRVESAFDYFNNQYLAASDEGVDTQKYSFLKDPVCQHSFYLIVYKDKTTAELFEKTLKKHFSIYRAKNAILIFASELRHPNGRISNKLDPSIKAEYVKAFNDMGDGKLPKK